MSLYLPRMKTTPVGRICKRLELILNSEDEHVLKSEASHRGFIERCNEALDTCGSDTTKLISLAVALIIYLSVGKVSLPGIALDIKDIPGILEVLVILLPYAAGKAAESFTTAIIYQDIIYTYSQKIAKFNQGDAELIFARDMQHDFFMNALGTHSSERPSPRIFKSRGFAWVSKWAKAGSNFTVSLAAFSFLAVLIWGNVRVLAGESYLIVKIVAVAFSVLLLMNAVLLALGVLYEYDFDEFIEE